MAMKRAIKRAIMVIGSITSLFYISSAQNCEDYKFSDSRVFYSCAELPVLRANLHWNYDSSENTLQIAYRVKQTPEGWIAWGINPTSSGGMIGTQALVAFQDPKGKMKVYSTPISSYATMLEPGPLTFPVSKLSAEYVNDEMIIFAILGPLSNGTTLNVVWQTGNSVSGGIPQAHPFVGPHLRSLETLDLLPA